MKIKRFRIYRPEIEAEFKRPILGRIYFLLSWPRFVILAKCQLVINTAAGQKPFKKIYTLVIPKFNLSDAQKE